MKVTGLNIVSIGGVHFDLVEVFDGEKLMEGAKIETY